MEYLRAVLNGRKLFFTNDYVKRVKVPRYKQLTLQKVLDFCMTKPSILKYLPDFPSNGEAHVDREFLFTIVNTVDKDYFPS